MISRHETITYVANKLGGAHLDQKRDTSKILELKYQLLDSLRSNLRLADRDPVFFEVLSIVNYLQQAPDIHKLRKRLRDLLGRKK